MGVIKVIITILLVIISLLGVLLLSYQFAQDNPFDTSAYFILAVPSKPNTGVTEFIL